MIKSIIPLIALVFVSGTLLSQSQQLHDYLKVADKVALAKNATSKSVPIIDDLFLPNESSSTKKNKSSISSAAFFDVNIEAIQSLRQKGNSALTFSIPYAQNERSEMILDVYPVYDLFDANSVSSKKTLDNSIHYRGIVRGYETTSLVALSVFENEVMGIVSIAGEGSIQIGKMTGEEYHVIYNDRDLDFESRFNCGSGDLKKTQKTSLDKQLHLKKSSMSNIAHLNISVFFVVDYDIYSHFNSDVPLTRNFVQALFNQVATLYENEGVNLKISEIEVLTSPDNYGTDPLLDFEADYPVFNGDLAHLISYQSRYRGGRAYQWALCYYSYGETRIDIEYENYPTYSASVHHVAHELGHNLGSAHTHACAWNGNNTQIDDCGNEYLISNNIDDDGNGEIDDLADAAEGFGCFDPLSPKRPGSNQGTIMSYCHLDLNIGVDLALGFGPQPGDRIREYILNSVGCLSEPFFRGDSNLDGIINILDAVIAARYSVGLIPDITCEAPISSTEICNDSADVDCDGTISILDAYKIARLAVDLPVDDCFQ